MRPSLAGQPVHRRLVGASAAVAATALLVIGLGPGQWLAPVSQVRSPFVAVTVYLQPRRAEASMERPVRAAAPIERRRWRKPADPPATVHNAAPDAVPRPPAASFPRSPRLVVAVPEEAAAPEPAASLPRGPLPERLRLDAEVLRAAASASRGSVMAMADAARGTEDRHNVMPSWTRSVGSAGRADCLAGDEHASLFSMVSIVTRAVTGRCP